MSTKLFVGGLPWKTTVQELVDAFSQAGTVVMDETDESGAPTGRPATTIVLDPVDPSNPDQQRRSRGFGFVTMATPEEGQKAIEMFNGQEFQGRTLTVNEARPREARPAFRRDF
jgi:RNA recognition motif-containing protein